MRKYFLSLFIFFMLFFSACGPSDKEIISYNDEIVAQQSLVIIAENELLSAISNKDSAIIPIAYEDLLYQIDKSIENTNQIVEIDNEISLKNAALNLFETYKRVVKNDYQDIIELSLIPESKYTKSMDSIFIMKSKKLNQDLNDANQKFFDTQKSLSEKFNIAFKIYSE